MATTLRPETPEHNSPVERLMNRAVSLNWETILWIVLLVVTIFTRFYILGDRVMSHDESLHTRFSYNLYADGNFQHSPLMHGPILFHATAFFYFLFGANDFTSRIYSSGLGVLLVLSPLLFRRWLGRWGTILAAIMLMISPLMLYYNRYIRHDTPSILFGVLMFYATMMYVSGPVNQRRRAHWLYLLAAALILNLGSKETSFIYIAVFGSFLTLYWLTRFAQQLWDIPGKTVFYFVIMGILFAGLASLGTYIIIDIIPVQLLPGRGTPLGELTPLEQSSFLIWIFMVMLFVVLTVVGTLFWVNRDRLDKIRWRDVVIILIIALLVATVLLVVEELSHTQSVSDQPAVPIDPNAAEVQGDTEVVSSTIRLMPMIGLWGVTIAAFAGLVVLNVQGRFEGLKRYLAQFPEFDVLLVMGTLVLPWLTALIPYAMRPSSTDYLNTAQGLPTIIYNIIISIPSIGTGEQVGQFVLSFIAWVPLMALAVTIGLLWDWKRWLIASAVFHFIFAFFFTTVFTNIAGLGTGMIYSLGYWLEQQGVRRGSQPQYYYLLIIMPFYEFLPIVGSVLAMFAGSLVFWRQRRQTIEIREEADALLLHSVEKRKAMPDEEEGNESFLTGLTEHEPEDEELEQVRRLETIDVLIVKEREATRLVNLPFLLFVAWWAILNLVGYSLAGEKMPWLGTHLTTPMIFLAAWYFGGVIEKINFEWLLKRGWLYLLLIPMLIFTVLQILSPFVMGQRPFAGLQQYQLQQTYSWLLAVALSGGLIYIIYRVAHHNRESRYIRPMTALVVFVMLGVITFRSAWIASFINYDYPTEFLVYAHAAPAIKEVLEDVVEDLSFRITDGKTMRFAYDDLVPWPYSWYFRDYPNAVFVGSNPTLQQLQDSIVIIIGDGNRAKVEPLLEDRYYRFDHMRLWWPMQEYFYLTAERVVNLFDLSPDAENSPNSAQLRQGIFDIWWSRDYSTYGTAINKDLSVTNWPVADRMHVYVRKDYAAQIWPYGVGEGSILNPLDEIEENVCNTNWQSLQAVDVLQASPQPLSRPLDISIGDDGLLYVAEEGNHRISVFDANGNYLRSFGQRGSDDAQGLVFERPNSVFAADDGSLYVVDTWNFRVQHLSADGQVLAQWGQAGQFGINAPVDPVDGFWGPRDIAIDAEGRIYIADTGNKRIRVYTMNEGRAVYLYDVGEGGSLPGQLDEPSSVVVNPVDGRIYVADTWNRRVTIYNSDGSYATDFRVRGWYQEQGNRPYLAIDENRGMVYVTDPDAGRVLVYTTTGDCVGSFGQLATEAPNNAQFNVVGGVAVDDNGFVYVADAGVGRILKFEPFPLPEPAPVDGADQGVDPAFRQPDVEVTDVVFPPASEVEQTSEVVPESTESVEGTTEVESE